MSRVIITENAAKGLKRCREFLAEKSLLAVKRAAKTISQYLTHLKTNPNMGRPVFDRSDLRELIIEFGDSGYIVLYRYGSKIDAIYLLAFRHQKEMVY